MGTPKRHKFFSFSPGEGKRSPGKFVPLQDAESSITLNAPDASDSTSWPVKRRKLASTSMEAAEKDVATSSRGARSITEAEASVATSPAPIKSFHELNAENAQRNVWNDMPVVGARELDMSELAGGRRQESTLGQVSGARILFRAGSRVAGLSASRDAGFAEDLLKHVSNEVAAHMRQARLAVEPREVNSEAMEAIVRMTLDYMNVLIRTEVDDQKRKDKGQTDA